MKFIGNLKDKLLYGIPAAFMLFVLAEQDAMAAEGIGAAAKKINENLDGIGDLIIAGSFLGGLTMSAAGLIKLKAAADSQGQQVKYGEGLWRLGLGSCLVAIPAIVKMGAATGGFEDEMAGQGGIKGF